MLMERKKRTMMLWSRGICMGEMRTRMMMIRVIRCIWKVMRISMRTCRCKSILI